jgi:hypothetical protein
MQCEEKEPMTSQKGMPMCFSTRQGACRIEGESEIDITGKCQDGKTRE